MRRNKQLSLIQYGRELHKIRPFKNLNAGTLGRGWQRWKEGTRISLSKQRVNLTKILYKDAQHLCLWRPHSLALTKGQLRRTKIQKYLSTEQSLGAEWRIINAIKITEEIGNNRYKNNRNYRRICLSICKYNLESHSELCINTNRRSGYAINTTDFVKNCKKTILILVICT